MIKTIQALSILLVLVLSSCQKKLSEEQKLFLDFGKLEDSYSGYGYYYNLDLHSNYEGETPTYVDSLFNFSIFKKELQDSFALIGSEDNDVMLDFSKLSYPIQFPHQIELKALQPNTYNVRFSIFIPNSYEKFSLSKKDIGTKFIKDGMNITLLDLRNDAATVLVENTYYKADYAYTYGIKNTENSEDTNNLSVDYGKYLFNDDDIAKPNYKYIANPTESKVDKNKGVLKYAYDRLSISVADEEGKCIESKGSIIDFRHYLWYRNNDMPYPNLRSSYIALKNRYKEATVATDYKYNPLDVVNIRGLGKMAKLNFFLRSTKGKVELIDLGEKLLQKDYVKQKTNYSTNPKYYPKMPIVFDDLKTELKPGLVNPEVDSLYYVYASLPSKYSNHMHFNFDAFVLKSNNNDSLLVNSYQEGHDDLIFNGSKKNIKVAKITKGNKNFNLVTGNIEVDIQEYVDDPIKINELPKGYIYDAITKTLYLPLEDFDVINPNFFAFEQHDLKKTIPYYYKDQGERLLVTFEKAPKIIIRRTSTAQKQFSIPFKLEITPK